MRTASRRFGENSDGAATFVRRWSARMRPWTRRYRPSAIDVGVLSGDVGDVVRGISEISSTAFAAGYVPVVIGGDHTVSYPVAATAAARHKDLTYVYLDAHLDLGFHLDGSGEVHNGNFVAALAAGGDFREVVNVGARAWTTYDDAYGPGGPVTVVRDVDPGALSTLRGRKVHVSLDVDVLDPVYVPNTGSKEPPRSRSDA